MTNQKVIELCAEIRKTFNADQKADAEKLAGMTAAELAKFKKYRAGEYALPVIIAQLEAEAREGIAAETAKAAGTGDKVKAARRIMDQFGEYGKPAQGVTVTDDAHYIIGGTYSAVKLYEAPAGLDLTAPEKPIDYMRFINPARENDGETYDAPTVKELRAELKIDKAAHKGERGYKTVKRFGDTYIDAAILLDVLLLIGDGAKLTVSSRSALNAVYLTGADGEAIIMPTRPTKAA